MLFEATKQTNDSLNSMISDELIKYADDLSTQHDSLLEEVERATEEELQYADMLSGAQVTGLLQMIVRMISAQRILEVGTFTGYGTLAMAQAAEQVQGAHIVTLDMNTRYAEIAQRYFKQYQGSTTIEQRMGAALDTIGDMPDDEWYDLIFIDADKANYPNYFRRLWPHLKPEGCMVFDNAFWGGEVLTADTRKGKAVDKLNRMVFEHNETEQVLLTVRDGLHIIRKKPK